MAEIRPKQIEVSQIETEDMSVHYGTTCALEHINLRIRSGEFVSLVGESGSGKTSLLNALAGFIPSSGKITVDGKFGVVFQDYAVFPWMTVSQNIVFGLKDNHHPERESVLKKHLKLIGLENHADKYPAQLSGGQIQRVGIARAFAPNPDVLFMDEPYGSLDRNTRDRMQKWLLDVWTEENKTIVFVTHDIEEAIFLSDRVLAIRDGTIFHEYRIPFERPRNDDLKFTRQFIDIKRTITEETFG